MYQKTRKEDSLDKFLLPDAVKIEWNSQAMGGPKACVEKKKACPANFSFSFPSQLLA